MTFSLRRKHPTTVRGQRWPIRMATSLLGFGLMLQAGFATAQEPQDRLQTPKSYYVEEALGLRGVREVPGLEVITRLEPESSLFERMKQEALKVGERIVFPEEPVLAKEPY